MKSTQRKVINMRMKILLSCIMCMLFALVLQTALFQHSSSQIIYSQAQEISRNTLENLQEDLYTFNKNIENSLIKLYNQKNFIRDLSMDMSAEELKATYGPVAYDLAQSGFIHAQNLTALYIYTSEHLLIDSYRHAQTPIYTYPEDIYDSSMESNLYAIERYVSSDERVMLLTSYYNPKRQTNLVRYVLKIYRNTSDYIGYIVCDVDPKPFLKVMEKYRYSRDQIVWLQPMGDLPVLRVGTLDVGHQAVFSDASASIAEGEWSAETGGNDSYEMFQASQRKYNLTVYSLMPRAVLELNQTSLLHNSILMFALILLVFSVLFLRISQSLTNPLTYVVNTMQRIRKGETGLRLKPMKLDEIGVLGQEFNDMLDETEQLIKREYQSQLLVNDAKYKALQAQVNPHFLYNTLDTMSSIATAQGSATVGTLCRALSNIFRYSLNMGDPFSTLESEILHIKNYMYVMNVRMNNSIQLDILIDSALLRKKVPRLSIQPLVENAIQHGLKNKRGAKLIQIGALRKENCLEVWVRDNGVGMDPEAVNKRLEHSVSDALHKNTSIGIDNINARAKLLYGNSYGVRVMSEIGVGSRVSLHIPYLEGEEQTDE